MSILKKLEKKHSEKIEVNYFKLLVLEKIFELIEQKGITQTELAKKMKLTKSQVSRLLANDRNLTIESVAKIFKALGEVPIIQTKSELSKLEQGKSKLNNETHKVFKVPYDKMPKSADGKKKITNAALSRASYEHKVIIK